MGRHPTAPKPWPEGTSAIANGWRAPALEGRVYPGLVLAADSAAAGLLLTDLSQREWGILDAFEDDRYDLHKLCLTSGAPGWAYVWPGGEVRDEDWDAEHFVTRHLQEYATRCARIAPDLAADAVH
nr:gamma-glutamylcyclotransferase family protein [Streptomyces sp. S1D4-11]QIZ01370.1 gamma-glutamylcyclotransferase [Streptomyces sp. S1D4-11]